MAYDFKTPEDVLRTVKDEKIAMIDLRFTDVPGLWQHFSVPPKALGSDSFEDGSGSTGPRSAASRRSGKATCW